MIWLIHNNLRIEKTENKNLKKQISKNENRKNENEFSWNHNRKNRFKKLTKREWVRMRILYTLSENKGEVGWYGRPTGIL